MLLLEAYREKKKKALMYKVVHYQEGNPLLSLSANERLILPKWIYLKKKN